MYCPKILPFNLQGINRSNKLWKLRLEIIFVYFMPLFWSRPTGEVPGPEHFTNIPKNFFHIHLRRITPYLCMVVHTPQTTYRLDHTLKRKELHLDPYFLFVKPIFLRLLDVGMM